MEQTREIEVGDFIETVRESAASRFYSDIWSAAKAFTDLPLVSRADFIRTPLSKRRYKDESGLVKIVRYPEGVFLSEWSFGDIGHERWGIPSKRPMVYLENPYEAIEKSMWCRERGMIPLIGERIAEVAILSASKYRVDSLIADPFSLAKFLPYLASMAEPLSSMTLIGEHFTPETLVPYTRFAHRTRLVLALPETGAIAEAELSAHPRFVSCSDCILEHMDTLVVTRRAHLTTPIIRYRTHIRTIPDAGGGFVLA